MFKFNFQINELDKENAEVTNDQICQEESNRESNFAAMQRRNKAEEIPINCNILSNFKICQSHSIEKLLNGNETIRHLLTGFILKDIQQNTSSGQNDAQHIDCMYQAERGYSDLLPGIYEGGAKIWECTDDLLNYLCKQKEKQQEQKQAQHFDEYWHNKYVLDIGCGCGLLGIYAYKNGAKVDFQDYNREVLEQITIPNVLLNMDPQRRPDDLLKDINENLKFYSGDWYDWLLEYPDKELYDVILTAETIYNPENYNKLLNCFYTKLKPHGTVWLAAKTNYFGVGGSLREFETLLNDKDRRFQSQVVWCSTNGVNREILQITKQTIK